MRLDRLRILVVSPFPPRRNATHGGARSIANLLEQLTERHDVALAFFRGRGEPPVEPELRARCDAVLELERGWTADGSTVQTGKRARLLAGLLQGRPSWATRWWSRAAKRRLAHFARNWRPDVVQLEFHIMAQYIPAFAGVSAPRVLVVHEPGYATSAETRSHSRGGRWLLARLEERGWLRFERKALTEVTAAVAFTPTDRATLERLGTGTPVHVIPLGIRIPPQASSAVGGAEPRLLFVGSFVHLPNVDAAEWLVRRVLPLVRERVPSVVVDVVGSDPEGALRGLAGGAVRAWGEVPDLEAFVEDATVVVLPIRRGGGMRVKTLEALAAGKAVVATPLAVAGLAVEHNVHVRVATTADRFAGEVAGLLEDPAGRVELGRRARDWACANLGWEGVTREYEALYLSLLGRGSTTPGAGGPALP